MRGWLIAFATASLLNGCNPGPKGRADNGLTSSNGLSTPNASSSNVATTNAARPTAAAPPAPVVPPEPDLPRLTGPQANAVRSAQTYLDMKGFSRAGLIEQLSSSYGEGYSVADATAAVDSLAVDWNENAVRSARDYLAMQGFSCSGLIEQLSSSYGEGYTRAQATHGARQAGAC